MKSMQCKHNFYNYFPQQKNPLQYYVKCNCQEKEIAVGHL